MRIRVGIGEERRRGRDGKEDEEEIRIRDVDFESIELEGEIADDRSDISTVEWIGRERERQIVHTFLLLFLFLWL